MNPRHAIFLFFFVLLSLSSSAFASKIRAVTVLTDHAWAVEQLGGKRVQVRHMLTGKEDPHHVSARPSLILMASRAQLFVSPGMDLDIGYTPLLLRNSRNAQIMLGGKGFVNASTTIHKLQVLQNVSRAMGDLHPQGNPHYHLDPIAIIDSGRAILQGLVRVDPGGRKRYQQNFKKFQSKMLVHLVGKTLVQVAGEKKLLSLLSQYKLISFLQNNKIKGRSLVRFLGGWMKKMYPLRGKKVITYHRQWAYFFKRFGLNSAGELEPKPGIPPSGKHLFHMINLCKKEKPNWIVSARFYPSRAANFVAKKTKVKHLAVPFHTKGNKKSGTYPLFIEHLIERFTKG